MTTTDLPNEEVTQRILTTVSAFTTLKELLNSERADVLTEHEREAIAAVLDYWGASHVQQLVEIGEQMIELESVR
jgi:hypothetical protein